MVTFEGADAREGAEVRKMEPMGFKWRGMLNNPSAF